MSPSSSSGAGTTRTSAEVGASRTAGVIGSPIQHSLSPALHRAAYAELGLTGWHYHCEEVRSGELAAYLAGRPADWVGLSVTRPGKEEALAAADVVSDVARLTRAANTLVRDDDSAAWSADNTDVEGIRRAFLHGGVVQGQPRRGLVYGSGATARSALVALQALGVVEVLLVVRDQARPATVELAGRLGLSLRVGRLEEPLPVGVADLAVSTVPALDPAEAVPPSWQGAAGCVAALDVIYVPWPTPWSQFVAASGTPVIAGVEMLLHQAAVQVELMTGLPAPVAAMRHGLQQSSRECEP